MSTEPPISAPMDKQDFLVKGFNDLLSGVGGFTESYLKGNSDKIEGYYRADEMDRRAQEESLNVKAAWNDEYDQEQRQAEKGAQEIGATVSAQAGQGVSVRSQASRSVTQTMSGLTAKDLLTLKNNVYAKTFGYRMDIIKDEGEAGLQRLRAKSASDAGLFGGLTKFGGAAINAVSEFARA